MIYVKSLYDTYICPEFMFIFTPFGLQQMRHFPVEGIQTWQVTWIRNTVKEIDTIPSKSTVVCIITYTDTVMSTSMQLLAWTCIRSVHYRFTKVCRCNTRLIYKTLLKMFL